MAEREAPAPDGMDDGSAARVDDTSVDGPVSERSAGDAAVDSQPSDRAEPRTPDQFTETPGSHRRGPDGPALDVGG
jgi:hypothetical protein